MTKDQIKTICEANSQLQWWAMVLFAEIAEMVDYVQSQRSVNIEHVWPAIIAKVSEFPRLIIQDVQERAEKQFKEQDSLKQRVTALEEIVQSIRKGLENDSTGTADPA